MDDDDDPECRYRLCGVIEHHGRGFNSGHYTSDAWNSAGGFWLHANDARLHVRALADVLQAQAYILFYRQVAPSSPPQRWGTAFGL